MNQPVPYPPLAWAEVARRRQGTALGDPLLYWAEIDSTNTRAVALAPDDAPAGAVLVAEHQTAGRGRLQRRWVATPGSGLTFTVVLGPLRPTWTAPMITGLAVTDALGALGITARLKWPNDVVIGEQKCAGILIEGKRVTGAYWLLAGIGINVRQVDPNLPTATYVDAHLAQPVRREDLLVEVLARLEDWRERGVQDPSVVRDAWAARLSTLGRGVVVQAPQEQFSGMAIGITDEGALRVRRADGSERVVQAGDVTLSPRAPAG
jgi:BirA family biotin operon repressor/biotin-[acetyl-CoA-carboxylase] ligase